MSHFVFVYRGGMPKNREEAVASLKRWSAWFDGLGATVIDKGAPLKSGKLLSSTATSNSRDGEISGYSVLSANSLQSAIELSKDCPIFKESGTVEIARALEV